MAGYHTIYNKNRCKKLIFFLIFLLFLLFPLILPNGQRTEAQANSGEIVMEATTKRILKGENIDARLPIASTTKAMTALVVIENCKMDDVVTVPKAAVGIEGSSIYLAEGEKLTVKELLYGLMLRSGNDAATALAIYAGGSVEGFAAMMNKKAESLGLKNTHFTNPHGLHDKNHYTSARDLAVIASEGMLNPVFKEIVSTKNITIKGRGGNELRYLHNKNKILSNYKGGNGVKTGYTKAAGRCLIAASERDGMQVVAVVINCPDMFGRCSQLMDFAHQNYVMQKVADKNTQMAVLPIKKGKKAEAAIYFDRDFYYPIKKDGSEKTETILSYPKMINAPHKKACPAGEAEIRLDNRLIFSGKLYTMEDIEEKTFLDRFKEFFKKKG